MLMMLTRPSFLIVVSPLPQAVVNLADVIAKHRTSRGAKMAAAG